MEKLELLGKKLNKWTLLLAPLPLQGGTDKEIKLLLIKSLNFNFPILSAPIVSLPSISAKNADGTEYSRISLF